MSNALTLFRLQQVDRRLDQIQSRLKTVQSSLENNAELKAAGELVEQAESSVKDIEKALKHAEHDSQDQRIKLEQIESSLYSGRIQNPKELKDLEADSASLKRRLRELEDIQLEVMLEIERARENLKTVQDAYNIVHGQVISQNISLQTEFDSLQKERDRNQAQRLAIVSSIDAASLSLYDELRVLRSGVAVSEVSDNSCESCGSSLTPGYAQSVRTSSQLVRCPMCTRILYSN